MSGCERPGVHNLLRRCVSKRIYLRVLFRELIHLALLAPRRGHRAKCKLSPLSAFFFPSDRRGEYET